MFGEPVWCGLFFPNYALLSDFSLPRPNESQREEEDDGPSSEGAGFRTLVYFGHRVADADLSNL